jgi:hypothetical protein
MSQANINELVILPATASGVAANSAAITVIGADSFTVQLFLTGATAEGSAVLQATLRANPTSDDDWDDLAAATVFAAKGSQIWKSEGNGRVSYKKIRVRWYSPNVANDGNIEVLANVVAS